MRIIHTLPVMIRSVCFRDNDLSMAKACFESLRSSEDHLVVLYNHGCLSNDNLRELLTSCGLSTVILGHGENIGIARARQTCFEYKIFFEKLYNNSC